MKGTQLAALAATAAALAACAPTQYASSAGGAIETTRWTATLAAPAGAAAASDAASPSVTGTATVAPGDSISLTRATVRISGATPGSTYPWHVHLGRCGDDKGIVGISSMYTPITAGADGKGEATVVLPYTTPNQGEFFVNVHAPARAPGIVACGNLALR
jgi:hypothetical protein